VPTACWGLCYKRKTARSLCGAGGGVTVRCLAPPPVPVDLLAAGRIRGPLGVAHDRLAARHEPLRLPGGLTQHHGNSLVGERLALDCKAAALVGQRICAAACSPALPCPWGRVQTGRMPETRAITGHNRDAWNGIAAARRANCPPPEFFAAGGSTLDPEETEAMGPVAGMRLLNLQCSSGNEALSWAALGATVTGVDISEVAIDIAREQAAAAGLDATFIASDVYDLPAELQSQTFDRAYSSAGITCWLPDLAEWARIIARTLRPGGKFVLDEHHPIWEVVSVRADGAAVTGDYFGRGRPSPPRPFDPQRAVHVGAEPVALDSITFIWPLGDVITALANAGMRIQQVTERHAAEMYASNAEAASWLPAAYLIMATKD